MLVEGATAGMVEATTGDTLTVTLSESQFIDVTFSNCSQSFSDSIFIEITEPSPSIDVISACGSYTWIDGNTYTESNNEATHTVPDPGGCDSTVTIELSLTINPNLTSTTNTTTNNDNTKDYRENCRMTMITECLNTQ